MGKIQKSGSLIQKIRHRCLEKPKLPWKKNSTEEPDSTELTDKINESLTDIMPGATVFDEDEKEEATPSENQEKNIFDNPLDFTVTDTRPNVAAEDLTEEEQAAIAVENHSCEGILVSGIELPWDVQFQVNKR